MSALVWITTNPMVRITTDGDLVTMWRRFAEVTIVDQVEAVRILIDPRQLPIRCRLFRPMVVAVMVAAAVEGVKACVGSA